MANRSLGHCSNELSKSPVRGSYPAALQTYQFHQILHLKTEMAAQAFTIRHYDSNHGMLTSPHRLKIGTWTSQIGVFRFDSLQTPSKKKKGTA